tara:strand:- start:15352 stop:16053 length:702 start_codon:yes stop_codon:yes gene_type:complete
VEPPKGPSQPEKKWRNHFLLESTNIMMFRQARILPGSCREQLWKEFQEKAAGSRGPLLFLVEDEESSVYCPSLEESAPLHFCRASSTELKERFLKHAHGLLLFPDEVTEAEDERQTPEGVDLLLFRCGASPICCLRTGRMLADFAASNSWPSELVVMQSQSRAPENQVQQTPGEILAQIIRSRSRSAELEKLAKLHPSYYFLAAGYVTGKFQRTESEPELENLRNKALQNCEN